MSGSYCIALTVTSDPNFDQRMIRICTSLHEAGYKVVLIGRQRPESKPLIARPYQQIRLKQLRYDKGKMFYATYNLKLLKALLGLKVDAICAIDLDTIVPVYMASKIKGCARVYDAHELFTEQEETIKKPAMRKIWLAIERHLVPKFPVGYTVNESLAAEFHKRYQVNYEVVRSSTVLQPLVEYEKPEAVILYQGAVNEGRCFEQLIPAMKQVNAKLVICGVGNLLQDVKNMVKQYGLEDKVSFEGNIVPEQLRDYTLKATIGITLFVATSMSNHFSLANRFFDYMHAGVPQLGVCYPEYERINNEFEVACLLPLVTTETVATALNHMLNDKEYYDRLQKNCLLAREKYCWQEEEKKLLALYHYLFIKAEK